MARKSKRMALNEAIRQGQAKISENLKKGQVKSDVSSDSKPGREKKVFLGPEKIKRSPVDAVRTFLKSKERSMFWGGFTPKMKLTVSLLAASMVVLMLLLWLAFLITGQPEQSELQQTHVAGTVSDENEKGRSGGLNKDESAASAGDGSSERPPSEGSNVICIQSIPFDRRGELAPLVDFFQRKRIDTEVLTIDGPSGRLAVLVTRDGFEQNPVKKGADGYELAQRIKQLGPVYVEETNDTKFGVKPFQDIYGLKR